MSPFLIRFTLILHILYLFSIDLEQHKDPECNSWGKHGRGLLSCCLLKLKTPRFLICFFIKFAFHCVPVRYVDCFKYTRMFIKQNTLFSYFEACLYPHLSDILTRRILEYIYKLIHIGEVRFLSPG